MQHSNNNQNHRGNGPQQCGRPGLCLNYSNIPTQYPIMHNPPENMACVAPNQQQIRGMVNLQGGGMQWTHSKNFNNQHPPNCKCRTPQVSTFSTLPTFPPQPQGIPLMPLGGAELYPVGNLNCMTPVGPGQNGQMCGFGGNNYIPQSYIEPGMYVDPAQWKEICKHQERPCPGDGNNINK